MLPSFLPLLPMPIIAGPPAAGFGKRSRPRSRYTGRILRQIRKSASRWDGQSRRECARRLRQMQDRAAR
ncbi:MAG: hypothetical protein K2X84_15955 [Beijerinckiaceae bacterium]|nr:hypothetical protein [Beijerinckiaceae bacterium]